MNRWARLSISFAALATALTLGWASASATSSGPPDVPQPPVHPATAQAKVVDVQTRPESLLVPVAPCRIVDTRIGGGRMGVSTTRSFYVASGDFVGQGGQSGGCGIPRGATAIAAVITAVLPSRGGYLKAYPYGTTPPNSSVLNYTGTTIGTGATLPMTNTSALALSVYNFGGPTDVIIDVQGYYIPQIQALIGSDGSILAGTPRVLSVTHAGVGFYYVTLDRPARQCSPSANTFNLYRYSSVGLSSSSTPNVISVFVWSLNATTHAETPTDYDFFLTVSC